MSIVKKTFKLKSGTQMPLVGFGTYKIRGDVLIEQVLDESFKVGFRLIDTATVYQNEASIGLALPKMLVKHNVSRGEIFLTTKIAPIVSGDRKKVRESVLNSLEFLNTTYLDLVLIHWPGKGRVSINSPEHATARVASWETLIELKEQGLIKAIGVSNFTVKHLEHLKQHSNVVPDVNQVECHPHYRQDELIEYCKKEGILVQAYSSLGTSNPDDHKKLLESPVVHKIATKLNVSPARLLLRWGLQRGLAIIPKAIDSKHIQDNIKLDFEISEEDMQELSSLPQEKYAWNPTFIA